MLFGYKIIAVCTTKVQSEDCYGFVTQVNGQLSAMGYRMFVYSSASDMYWNYPSDEGHSKIYDLIPYDIVDELIIMDEKINDKKIVRAIIEEGTARDIPITVIGQHYDGCMSIGFDYAESFSLVVRHVLDHHHARKVHLIAGMPNNSFSDDRIAVCRRLLEERGIPLGEEDVSYGHFWEGPARDAVEKLIEQDRVPEAIICVNDSMAIAVCDTLKEHHIPVPEQVIVTGFDGIDDIYYTEPLITSARCRYEDIADRLVQLLQIPAKERKKERYLVEPHFIQAESCGCPTKERRNAFEALRESNTSLKTFCDDDYILTEHAALMQISKDLLEASTTMDSHVFRSLVCVLNLDCVDEKVHPLSKDREKSFDDVMYVFYDDFAPKPFKPYKMPRSKIIPNIEEQIKQTEVLVFSALSFLYVPMGYVCFRFADVHKHMYVRLPQVINSLNTALGSLRNMRYQQYLTRQIEEMYMTDMLTGLYNRHGFDKMYQKVEEKLSSEGGQLTIVFADVDGLKTINDVYGHKEGDNAIRTSAKAFVYAMPEAAICMRFGGDEIVGVVSGAHDKDQIRNSFLQYLKNYNDSSEKPYQVSASIGVYVESDADQTNIEALMRKADELMYLEKRNKHRARAEAKTE